MYSRYISFIFEHCLIISSDTKLGTLLKNSQINVFLLKWAEDHDDFLLWAGNVLSRTGSVVSARVFNISFLLKTFCAHFDWQVWLTGDTPNNWAYNTWCAYAWVHSGKKVKFSHTCYRALGPELIPVYRQSTRRWLKVIHPAVGCHYFPPGLRFIFVSVHQMAPPLNVVSNI